MVSVLHHTTNVHRWQDSRLIHSCSHAPLSEDDGREIEWLDIDYPNHQALFSATLNIIFNCVYLSSHILSHYRTPLGNIFLLIGSQEFLFKIQSVWWEKNKNKIFFIRFCNDKLAQKTLF